MAEIRVLRRAMLFSMADAYLPGWEEYVLIQLRKAREELPDADVLYVRLETLPEE